MARRGSGGSGLSAAALGAVLLLALMGYARYALLGEHGSLRIGRSSG